MQNKLFKRNVITAAAMVVVIFASSILSIYRFLKMDLNIYANDIRMLVAKQRNEIEKGMYNDGKYPYISFGLDGKVVYNDTAFEYKKGDIINVQ